MFESLDHQQVRSVPLDGVEVRITRSVLEYQTRRIQVAKVTAVSIPLAVLVGFCEECVYRGFFPLFLAARTRLPLAAIVGLSAVFCGVSSLSSVYLSQKQYCFV